MLDNVHEHVLQGKQNELAKCKHLQDDNHRDDLHKDYFTRESARSAIRKLHSLSRSRQDRAWIFLEAARLLLITSFEGHCRTITHPESNSRTNVSHISR